MVDQERRELYKTIWGIANQLRGAVDGWDFKQYVLGFLFYRYISEDFSTWVKEFVKEGDDFDYANVDDKEDWVESLKEKFIEEKGYFIYPSELFQNVAKRAFSNDETNLNEEISNIFKNIEMSTWDSDAREHFEGLFQCVDLSDIKLGGEVVAKNKTIKGVLKGISEMKLKLGESDMFGDAYEYLIGMYAANAGKSGGEYFTPPEVSELLVSLCVYGVKNKKIRTVYDPTCGSGSLLLKFKKKAAEPEKLRFFGQEINITIHNLCRMNMFLHDINFEKFKIASGCTLLENKFLENGDKTSPILFDAIVSNPPFSVKWKGKDDANLADDPRFTRAGALAPKDKADLAFVQHSIHHLENSGIAAIICFPGVLYREKAEKEIRKWLVSENYVDAVIQLPDKLFYGTTIAACILVLKKSKQEQNTIFIDASSFFEKAENRNKLNEENIERIMQIYKDRKDVEELAKVVDISEIEEKEFNLSVDAYVIKKTIKEVIDIVQLEKDLDARTERINQLRKEIKELTQKLREEFQIEEKSE